MDSDNKTLARVEGRWRYAIPGLLVALIFAAVFRISFSHYSLWSDELASVFFAGQPFHNLWSDWMLRETNPPLYYSLLRGWIAVVGLSVVKVRLLSIVGGLFVIVAAYAGVGKSYGRRAGVIAAVMLALSAQHLGFSMMVRSYIFVYLAISISFYGLLNIARVQDVPDRQLIWSWAAYVGGAIAGVYFHTTAVLWPIAATVSLILVDHRYRPFIGKRWLHLVFADVLIVAATAWWLWITYLQISTPNGNISWIVWPGLQQTVSLLFSTLFLSRNSYGWEKIIPISIALLGLLGVLRTADRTTTRLTLACPIIAIALFMALSLKQPVIMDKTIFWLSIFPLTLAAIGLDRITDTRWFVGIGAVVLLLLAYNLAHNRNNFRLEDWTTPIAAMSANPRAVLLVDGESMGVAANAACAVELGKSPCPFPIITLQRDDDQLDPWALGYAPRSALTPSGMIALPANAQVYIFRRKSHDALATLHRLGLLPSVRKAAPNFLGPYPPTFTDSLRQRAMFGIGIGNGLIRVQEPPIHE